MSPQRIQLRRTKGWRKPEGAIVVARPSMWGNPFTVRPGECGGWLLSVGGAWLFVTPVREWHATKISAAASAVAHYRREIDRVQYRDFVRSQLADRDLCCWCPLDAPCHADVLLELANR